MHVTTTQPATKSNPNPNPTTKHQAIPLWRAIDNCASNNCGLSTNSLDKLNSPVIPGTSCFYGNWVENVRAGQFMIFGDFVGSCLVRRCTCLCGSVANV